MQKIILTGVSSGLGKEIGNLFLNKGYEVINLSRNKAKGCTNIHLDLSDKKSIKNAVKQILANHSDFETLILNSGIMPQAEIGDIKFDMNELFQVNVIGSMQLVNELDKKIRKNGADIVLIGSTSAFKHFKGDTIYSATKHAVRGFIQSLQSDYKLEKTRVIGFHPGGFNSNLEAKKFQVTWIQKI
jgi:NADP-dependent 3-hydroxy acid dehydrogenase YdfG